MAITKMKECKEYIQDGVWYDDHEWVEVFTSDKMQSLKCAVCGKRSTAKFAENYQPPEDQKSPQ